MRIGVGSTTNKTCFYCGAEALYDDINFTECTSMAHCRERLRKKVEALEEALKIQTAVKMKFRSAYT